MADLDLASWLGCSPKGLLKKLMVAPVWEPAVSRRGEALTRGRHTTTATSGALVKRQMFPGLLTEEKWLSSGLHYDFDLIPPQPVNIYNPARRILSVHIVYL